MSELDRRAALLASAATALTAAAPSARAAEPAATPTTVGAYTVNPRGTTGIYRRMRSLDLASFQNFLSGRYKWLGRSLNAAANARAQELFKTHGIAPDSNPPYQRVVEILEADPVIALTGKTWCEGQLYKFDTLRNEFHRNADMYYEEMEANDKAGPGTLELNPKMVIPEYARHEIHNQPGGFCGDPFAGYIYHYGVLYFYDGKNDQDEIQNTCAALVSLPQDGKVKRILDMGTGIGQLATSLKARFPEAEVWGLDVGGPMVRYAHVRANGMGVDVNFRQALAEDTGFPDGYFDIVASYQMHHEATADASTKIFKEAQRILRPGGHYFPIDAYTASRPAMDPFMKYRAWWTYRWNHEDWIVEWRDLDARDAIRKAGLKLEDGPIVKLYSPVPNYCGVKV